MFDPSTVRLMHPHGDEMVPMLEVSSRSVHDASEFDPERDYLRGARIYECPRCKEQVHVADPATGPGPEA